MSIDYLKTKHPHERDARIFFDEEPHIYYVDSKAIGCSVTTLVHRFFPKFEPDTIIHRMMNGRNWNSSNKYYGMTPDEIKQTWENLGKEATTEGTKLHKSIEVYYNNMHSNPSFCLPSDDEQSDEYKMFLNFAKEHTHLKPYRTEWEVFDETSDIAGSIDMIFENDDGTLSIYDWKRTKEIKLKNPYKSKGFSHLQNFDDCNYIHYSLQLNIYKYILEKHYGVHIRDMFLVCMHPTYTNYKKYEVCYLQPVVENIFNDLKESF